MHVKVDIDDRVQLCPFCYHQQSKGYWCERCNNGTMRIHAQMAQALKISAAHEEIMRNGVALPDVQTHRAQ